MTVVVDTTASGEVDLYVDADRNLKIDDRDRVRRCVVGPPARRERIWRLPLDVALVENGAVRTDAPRRRVPPGCQRPDARLCRGRLSRGIRLALHR